MNNALLVGRLARDAEVVEINNGGRKAIRFTLAVSRSFKNMNGEVEADFIPVVYFTNYSDKLISHLTKGRMLSVAGKISVRSLETEENTKRYFTNVEASRIEFVGKEKVNVI